jgi:hypothetical protein
MKNIHVIKSDKPSRLHLIEDTLKITKEYVNSVCDTEVNIYITNDEKIKEGDCIFYTLALGFCKTTVGSNGLEQEGIPAKKIILTTDEDLIKDGVQAIDDEFLEWYVKNPSCEEVIVEIDYNKFFKKGNITISNCYEIIIPKKESNKTHYFDELPNMDKEVLVKMWESAMPKLKPKQETLEEAAEKYVEQITTKEFGKPHNAPHRVKTFIDGAKWQAARMYSEEEIKPLLSFIRGIKHNWDCDKDSYKYGTGCRCCDAEKILRDWFEKVKSI